MADYSVRIAKHAVAGAGVDHVELKSNPNSVEVVNRSSGNLWFRTDDVDPVVNGDDCQIVPPNAALTVPAPELTTMVRVLVEGGGAYSVLAR